MSSATLDLSALLKMSTIEDHEEVLKACNARLKQSKNDPEAQHVKVIALLKLERYEDALRVLDAAGDTLKQKALFERAYTLYRTGDYEHARDIAKSIKDDRGARHIAAQASYRTENFSEAAEIYEDLAKTQEEAHVDEENDLRINSGATDAQLEWNKHGDLARKKKPNREDLEVFETAYNAACASIAREELGQGEVLLQRAKDLCNALDELSDQQKLEELLPISVQQLYVLSRLGKHEDAKRLSSDLALSNIPDLSTKQIGQNNKLASATIASNPYLAHRLFQEITSLPKTDQLFQYQAEKIQENRLVLDLSAGKSSAVVKSTFKDLLPEPCSTSSHINNLAVLNAAAHSQNELGKMGLRKILPLLEKRPLDVGLALTIIQLYVLTNNHGSALTVMESLLDRLSASSVPAHQDVRFAPGLIATLVSLYKHQNRRSQVVSALAKAASHWRHKRKPPVALLEAAGLGLLESSEFDDKGLAQGIFTMLHEAEPSSPSATAGYVAAHSTVSIDKVSTDAKSLTPIQRLIADVDVAALESAGVPIVPTMDALTAKRKRALDEKPKPTKKRIRKSKLPKDYDAGKTPDPERWLPLRDRSTYKPKGKKGRKKVEALTQGGVGDSSKDAAKGGGEGVIQARGGGGGAKKKKGKK